MQPALRHAEKSVNWLFDWLCRLNGREAFRSVAAGCLCRGTGWRQSDVDRTSATVAPPPQVGDARLQPNPRVRGALSRRRLRSAHRHLEEGGRRSSRVHPLRRLPATHGLVVLRPHSSRWSSVDRTVGYQDVGRRLVRVFGAVSGWQWRHQYQRHVDTSHR